MKMQRFVKIYIPTFVALFFSTFITEGIIANIFNAAPLEGIRKPQNELNFTPLMIDFVFLALVLTYFLLKINTRKDFRYGAIIGAIFGGMMFFNAGLSNVFVLPRWPLSVVIVDAIAVAVSCAVTSLLTTYLDRRIK